MNIDKKTFKIFSDNDIRYKLVSYLCLFFANVAMIVVNIHLHIYPVVVGNGIFMVGAVVNCFLLSTYYRKNRLIEEITDGILLLAMLACFIIFIVIGEPSGVPVLWVLLVPAFSILFLKKRNLAKIYSFFWLVIIVFFFWTPIGRSLLLYAYDRNFLFRFPVLYGAFIVISFSIESNHRMRNQRMYDKAKNAYKKLRELASVDNVTNGNTATIFHSRYPVVMKHISENYKVFFFVISIDNYATLNNLFGFNIGSNALKYVYAKLNEDLDGLKLLCRAEGSTFFALVACDNEEMLLNSVESVSKKIKNFDKDFAEDLNNKTFQLKLKIGCYEIEDREEPIDQVIFKTQVALKNPKEISKYNGIVLSKYGIAHLKDSVHQRIVIENLRQALVENQFEFAISVLSDPNSVHAKVVWIKDGRMIENFEECFIEIGIVDDYYRYIINKAVDFCCKSKDKNLYLDILAKDEIVTLNKYLSDVSDINGLQFGRVVLQ